MTNMCDVILDPALEEEGFGRTIIEAFACGTPVVSTGRGGPTEIIENGITGIITDPDPKALAQEVQRLLADETMRKKLIDNALERVHQEYTITSHIKKIEGVYEDITR